jgi:competence protein ComEC
VVPVGLAGATAGAIWAPLGKLPLAAAGLAARAVLAIAGGFRAHAPLWLCRTPNGLETAALTAAGCLALVAAGAPRRARRLAAAGAIAAALLAAGSLVRRDLARRHARDLTVTFLDIGQGDAAVIEAPGAGVMLIDGGGVRDGSFDTGARIVEPFLRARGIGRLDIVALSHPHPDHLNGLFRVLGRFDVDAFWSSGDDGHNPEYGRIIGLARSRGIAIPEVSEARLGAATVVPLGPFDTAADRSRDLSGTLKGSQSPRDATPAAEPPSSRREHIAAPPGLSVNDASLVVRVGFAGRGVLFAGDLEADGEGELVGRRDVGQVVAADVLKVPHHGSRTSSSPELVEAVSPALAVISLGWRNQFHFPAPEVVERYVARGARVLRTDRDGAISVVISPEGRLSVRCERGCPEVPAQPKSPPDR